MVVLLASALARMRRTRQTMLLAWIGFTLSGILFAQMELLEPPPNHLARHVQEQRLSINRPLRISGWMQTPSQARPGSYIFDLATEAVEQDGRRHSATGVIRVYYYPKERHEPAFKLPYGTRVELLVGNLRAPRNYGNPGMFDYAASMRRRGISYSALLRNRDEDLVIHSGTSGSRLSAVVLDVREAMIASIGRLLPDAPREQSILRAMLLGDDNWLQERTEQAFQRSGTYHVLVISGWNVAVFAGPLLLLLTRFRMANWLSSLLVFLTVASFALIAQWEIPIVRASTMFLIYLLTRLFFRHRALTNSLAATALLLLAIHPSDLFDWGFQLSFLAVLTLSTIALPAVEWKISPLRHALDELFDPGKDTRFSKDQIQFRADLRTLSRYIASGGNKQVENQAALNGALRGFAWAALALAEAVFFTTLMQVGFALVSAHYFHRLTWSGILGNLFILPFASCIVLLGMFLIPVEIVLPWLGKLLGPLLGWLCLGLEGVAEFASELESLNLRVPTPTPWASMAFLCASILLAVLVSRRSRFAIHAGIGLLMACVWLSFPARRAVCRRGELEVTAMDVGQGDALLICFPGGSSMLVDAGGTIPIPGSPVRRQDIGETVVSAYLWHRGISEIDYVVLSHDHFDHMGGLEAVFENFRVGEFWMGPDAENRKMDWLRRRAARAGAKIIWPLRAAADTIVRNIDGVRVEVLSPPGDWEPTRVSNNDSIVLRLTYGSREILLAGDIESRMERALAAGGFTLKSDVLKVPHHGSRTSSTPEFLSRVSPQISIVSVGAHGRFGHPDPEVLERLAFGNKLLYTTPASGAISIRTDGNRLQVETFYGSNASRAGL